MSECVDIAAIVLDSVKLLLLCVRLSVPRRNLADCINSSYGEPLEKPLMVERKGFLFVRRIRFRKDIRDYFVNPLQYFQVDPEKDSLGKNEANPQLDGMAAALARALAQRRGAVDDPGLEDPMDLLLLLIYCCFQMNLKMTKFQAKTTRSGIVDGFTRFVMKLWLCVLFLVILNNLYGSFFYFGFQTGCLDIQRNISVGNFYNAFSCVLWTYCFLVQSLFDISCEIIFCLKMFTLLAVTILINFCRA